MQSRRSTRRLAALVLGCLLIVAGCDDGTSESKADATPDTKSPPTDTTYPDLGCATNPSCCPNPDSPYCNLPLSACRTETDCYVKCGRCILAGCSAPSGICRDTGAGDATASDADHDPDSALADTDPGPDGTTDPDTGDHPDAETASDASNDADAQACPDGEVRVADACRQCGPAGGCADQRPACRSTCAESECSRSGFTCGQNDVCQRICF